MVLMQSQISQVALGSGMPGWAVLSRVAPEGVMLALDGMDELERDPPIGWTSSAGSEIGIRIEIWPNGPPAARQALTALA